MSIVEKPGYSAVVDLQLVVGGQEISVGQMGPDFCVLSQSAELPATTKAGSSATTIVCVDGTVTTRDVELASVEADERRRIFFRVVE